MENISVSKLTDHEHKLLNTLLELLPSNEKKIMNGEIEGEIEGKIEGKIDEEIEGQIEGEIEGKIDEEIEGEIEGEIDEEIEGEIEGKIVEKIEGKIEGGIECRIKIITIIEVNTFLKKNDKINGALLMEMAINKFGDILDNSPEMLEKMKNKVSENPFDKLMQNTYNAFIKM